MHKDYSYSKTITINNKIFIMSTIFKKNSIMIQTYINFSTDNQN